MKEHRHTYVVTRRVPNTEQPFTKECVCGKIMRYHRGRWVMTNPPSEAGYVREQS